MGFFKRLGALFSSSPKVAKTHGTYHQSKSNTQNGHLRDTSAIPEDIQQGLDSLNRSITTAMADTRAKMEEDRQRLMEQARLSMASPCEKFLYGIIMPVSSSNVAFIQYAASDKILYIGFKNGGWYGYHDVNESEAASLFNAGSKGGWVWDVLRERGTVFGHKKEYFFMDGPSNYEPKWHQDAHWRAEHGSIAPDGQTPETWQQGQGPYPAWYGLPKGKIKKDNEV